MASSRVFRDAVKSKAPIKTGALKKAISAASVKSQKPTAGVLFKKVKVAKKDKSVTPFYWRFIEYGCATQDAHPFIRPAFDANIEKASKVGMETYEKEIEAIFDG